ncbi:hypothetical protein O9G_004147 [Rozella allomycis CSF55]|uniref:Uncharacterized protein n=1 Tax=Rozella allomycis (strain CSF55) TaxID=988480 RepID=A0A075B3Y0_ROZAC|nr:hypothetical protein O9G_004147 [Rozella allomycis CSF55]|eukprot:EPZ35862.1 hypothetical protein O9G_004147 [Rozella allomycis CSF55]
MRRHSGMKFSNEANKTPTAPKEDPIHKVLDTIQNLSNKIVELELQTKQGLEAKIIQELENRTIALNEKYEMESRKYQQEITELKKNAVTETNLGDFLEDDTGSMSPLKEAQEKFEKLQENAMVTIKEMLNDQVNSIKNTIFQQEKEQFNLLEQDRQKMNEYLAVSKQKLDDLACSLQKSINTDKTETKNSQVKEIVENNPTEIIEEKSPVEAKHSFEPYIANNEPEDEEWKVIIDVLESNKYHQKDMIVDVLDDILVQRGINKELMRNPEAVENKIKQLRQDRINIAESNPYFLWMRDYISSKIEGVVDERFQFDSKQKIEINPQPSPLKPRRHSFNFHDKKQVERRASIRSESYSKMLKPVPPAEPKPRISFRGRKFRQSVDYDYVPRRRSTSQRSSAASSPIRWKENSESSYESEPENLSNYQSEEEYQVPDEPISQPKKASILKPRRHKQANQVFNSFLVNLELNRSAKPSPIMTIERRRSHKQSFAEKSKESLKKAFNVVRKNILRRPTSSDEELYEYIRRPSKRYHHRSASAPAVSRNAKFGKISEPVLMNSSREASPTKHYRRRQKDDESESFKISEMSELTEPEESTRISVKENDASSIKEKRTWSKTLAVPKWEEKRSWSKTPVIPSTSNAKNESSEAKVNEKEEKQTEAPKASKSQPVVEENLDDLLNEFASD